MSGKGLPRKPGARLRIGRRAIGLPTVPSMADADRPAPPAQVTAGAHARPRRPIDRAAVQYLDRVRAVFRPAGRDGLAPELERFIGSEDVFRHVGTAPHGAQPMMQCPPHWPAGTTWVPIGDLEILEILEDQDVRAG